MNIKAGFYIKKIFWQLLWGDGYKEKIKETWKKIPKNSCETLSSSVFFLYF